LGEAIRAYVALEAGAALTDKEIKAHCLARLENFMVPKEVLFLPELPKTATGKIRKKDLSREPL
jgi:acyl-coenzyme A synthetase/AMP-(fatty) acid ligase